MFAESIADAFGPAYRIAYALTLLVLAPLVSVRLFLYLFDAFQRGGHGWRFGLWAGCTVALWASTCWLFIPYCGAYPNLPGVIVGGWFFAPQTWGMEMAVYATNFMFWPLVGCLVYQFKPTDQVGAQTDESEMPGD